MVHKIYIITIFQFCLKIAILIAIKSNNLEYKLHFNIKNTMNSIQQTHTLPKVNNHKKYINLQSFKYIMNACITTYWELW